MCGLCTYVRRGFASNKRPRGRIPARASAGAQSTAGGTGLGAQQELTQQLSCLWFPKRVHL